MFFLINKPLGISSYDVVRSVKKQLQTRKVGHAGTLDPLATGCLLIATDKSTKLLHLLGGSKKHYRFTVQIDGSTESYDLGTPITPIVQKKIQNHSEKELKDFLLSQTEQIPPLYSALHINGERAYELARRGETQILPARPIVVEDVQVLKLDLPQIEIALTISSGGYIRSFAPCIGRFFGSSGGYITELHRQEIITPYSTLSDQVAQDISHFDPTSAISYKILFPHIPFISISEESYQALKQGKIIPSISEIEGILGEKYFFQYKNEYLSLVEFSPDGFHIVRNDL